MKQRYLKRQPANMADVQYFQSQGIPLSLAEALSAKGFVAADFPFNRELFHSPFLMKNMQEAVETISYILEDGGTVLIYGDYDTDGLTASAILSLFFTDNGVENDVIIPTREAGYGMHTDLVLKAFEKKFYDLIITVDCGISNREEIAQITDELGVEVIVTDHHELPSVLPDCLCVNPKMGYPFPGLAGAGVAWKLVEALAGREVAARYSTLAMIGTIGDMMPLRDENRSLVTMGQQNINHKSLQKLFELARCSNPPTTTDVVMKISSRINAAGRMGHPELALKMLLARDKADMSAINAVNENNDERKVVMEKLIQQAEGMLNEAEIYANRVIFLCGEGWPQGLLGIIAARLKAQYNLPAVLLTNKEDEFVGSARGTDDIDLFELFCNCKDLLVHFGGHKASVGLSVRAENLEKLHARLAQLLNQMDAACFEKRLEYDAELEGLEIPKVMEFLQSVQPISSQDKFVFKVNDCVKFANSFGKDHAHLSVTLSSGLELKGFGYGIYAPYIKNGANIQALITLENDEFAHKTVGILEDLQICNSVCFDSFYKYNFLKNFQIANVQCCAQAEVRQILQQSSVLAVFDDYETYLKVAEEFCLDDFAVDIFLDNSIWRQTVAISPNVDYGMEKYENILYFCNAKVMRSLPPRTKYFFVAPANENLYKLDIDRQVCATVYSQLKKKTPFDSVVGVYDKYLVGKVSYEQYIVALRVFEELKFIKVEDRFNITFLPSEKMDLNSSAIFRCFQE